MSSEAIIFVPGIKGTKLVETNRANFDTIWSGIQSNFETIEDLELSYESNGERYDQKIDTLIAPGEIEELAYAEFLRDLNTDKPVYIFNYDWRQSAQKNGALLAQFVDRLIEKSKAAKLANPKQTEFKKFDFITHSLGNLLVRYYIKHHGFAKINRIVFTVPPFKGAIDIASAALIGEGFFPNVKAKMRKLIRVCPGALELLPNYDGASRFDSGSSTHNFYNFKHWQANATDMGGNKKKRSLAERFRGALKTASRTVNHELCDLSTLPKAERDRILVVVRTGYETPQFIRVNRKGPPKNLFDFENGLVNKNGDGRVPHGSSCCHWNDVTTVIIEHAFWEKDYSHGFVLKDERVQKLVNRFLQGKPLKKDPLKKSVKIVVGLVKRTENGMPYWDPLT